MQKPSKDELEKLIAVGEGFSLEFKRTEAHLGREICAFANSGGGRILVGVDDAGTTHVGRIQDTRWVERGSDGRSGFRTHVGSQGTS